MTGSTASSATVDQPIGFFDSGIGGLPYLERVRELLPEERFVYLADRRHFPYGVRSRDAIRDIVITAVSELVDAVRPKIVVVACNTASVVSLSELRRIFNLPFVGVVPAIKPAGTVAPGARIGVLATERTVQDPYVANLIREFAPNNELVLVSAGGLVETIESGLAVTSCDEIIGVLRRSAEKLIAESVHVVVLGCTHFIHIRDELSELLGDEVPVLDSVEGVARQIVRVCGHAGHAPHVATDRHEEDLLLVTGDDDGGENYHRLAVKYNLKLLAYESVK